MTREQLIDITVDTLSDTEMDLLMNILETPTEEQQKCEYCHNLTIEERHKLKVKYCEVCGRKLGDD